MVAAANVKADKGILDKDVIFLVSWKANIMLDIWMEYASALNEEQAIRFVKHLENLKNVKNIKMRRFVKDQEFGEVKLKS